MGQARAIPIPEDLSIVAHDDPVWFNLLSPRLTTIAQAHEEAADLAAELLRRRMEGGAERNDPPLTHRLGSTLIERASCAPPCLAVTA